MLGKSESKKMTFRFSGYNFLNHPNWTFLNGDNALNLQFNSSGNPVNVGGVPFGYVTNKTGHRIVQGELKYTF